MPTPNDGICPWCAHSNGPKFGRFVCDSCDGFCHDNPGAQRIAKMSGWEVLLAVLGGLVLACGLIGGLYCYNLIVDWLYQGG